MYLLFSFNKNVINQFYNCITSIKKNGGYDFYNVYILHCDLTTEDQKEINQFCGTMFNCFYISIDNQIFKGFPTFNRYPLQIYYRIIAPLMLPKEVEKILYLDVDTIVINSLKPLMKIEIKNHAILGCTHVHWLNHYFNKIRLGVKKIILY